MAGLVVQTSSEPEHDHVKLDLMVQFQVWGAPPDLTSVWFKVLFFQSKTAQNQTTATLISAKSQFSQFNLTLLLNVKSNVKLGLYLLF